MDNEATKVLNEQQKETQSNVKDEKKGTNVFGQGMATAAGAAVGTGAAMAADRVYEHVTASAVEEEIPEEEQAEEATNEESVAEEEVVAEEVQAAQEQPQHTVVEHVVTVKVEAVQPEPITASVETAVPADAELVDDSNVIAAVDTTEDNEVHVIGAMAVEKEEGGQAILIGLEASDGDRAMVVDIDSDGTIDYLVHDDNRNGQIEEEEAHDIHEEGLQTGAYLSELEEQQVQQEMAMNDDEMPDYMNDVDAGMMDA